MLLKTVQGLLKKIDNKHDALFTLALVAQEAEVEDLF